MKDQMEAIVQEKILLALDAPLPKLTPRDARMETDFQGWARMEEGLRAVRICGDLRFIRGYSRSKDFNTDGQACSHSTEFSGVVDFSFG